MLREKAGRKQGEGWLEANFPERGCLELSFQPNYFFIKAVRIPRTVRLP